MPAENNHTHYFSKQKIGAAKKFLRLAFGRRSGSLTVEAALVMPLCLFALAAVYSLFGALGTAEQINVLLCSAARQTAAFSAAENGTGTAEAAAFFAADCLEQGANLDMAGGAAGILLQAETSADHIITLHAHYRLKLPLHIRIPVTDTVSTRAWLGETGGTGDSSSASGDGGGQVYVAENGVAYHKDPNCVYLHPGIRSVAPEALSGQRNIYGSRYKKCALCGDDIADPSAVYITAYGETYHTSRQCSALKRTVGTMTQDDAAGEGLHACPKCGGGE